LAQQHFSGTIPTELGNLPTLDFLSTRQNDLTGTIPSEIANIKALSAFWADGNNLSGTIPQEIWNSGSITELKMEDNDELTGSIPDSACHSFEMLDFSCTTLLCGCNCTCA